MKQIHLSEQLDYKRIFQASYAPILMTVFTSLYSIIDGVFISNFAGDASFAGLNLVFPFIMVLASFGFMLGTGGSALVSIDLGQGDKEKANQHFSMIFYFVLILGVLLGIIGFFTVPLFAKQMASLSSGNTEEMVRQGTIYGRILCGGILLYMLQNLFQVFFIAAEKPRLGFLTIFIAGCTNIGLDALFIAGFKWGIVGAAVATLIGQSISSIFPIVYFLKKKDAVIHFVKTKLDFRAIGQASFNGSSEFVSNISGSIVSSCYNAQLLKYVGQNGVSSYGIIMYVSYIFMAIFMGYSTAMSPFVGYQYGAENHKELHNILKRSLILIAVMGALMFGLAESLAEPLARLLSSGNEDLVALTIRGERIYAFVYLTCGFSIFSSSFFTALNNGTVSAIISFVRSLVFEIVCVFTMPLIFSVNGIYSSAPFAEIGSSLMTVFFLIQEKKKYQY